MKQDLSWLKSLITNYREAQLKLSKETEDKTMYFMHYGAVGAADDILELIKEFIADSNKLIEEQKK